jgi:hypothetical protein
MAGKDDKTIHDRGSHFPKWNHDASQQSVNDIYEWVIGNALMQIDWYSKKLPHKRFFSLRGRFLVLFCAAIGILCPLLDASQPAVNLRLSECFRLDFLKIGYIAFALAGIIVMCDKYFGLSTGWMRFIETKLKLEEALKAFYMDWAELSARKAGEAEMITKMKGFVLQVESLVSHESALWIREFKSNLSSIDDMVKKNK